MGQNEPFARIAPRARVARDQWTRRVRFRNYLRCDHPALSWSAHRRAAGAVHGRMVMWSHVSEFLRFA